MKLTYNDETFTLEMWTTNWDGTTGDTVTRRYPSTTRNGTNTRRHDALRNLASYALATPKPGYPYATWVRPSRSQIRVNSAQGVAWVVGHPSHVAYFDNTDRAHPSRRTP